MATANRMDCRAALAMTRNCDRKTPHTLVIARPQAVAIHVFGGHGLLHCVRNDGKFMERQRVAAIRLAGYNRPGYKSCQSAFNVSIKATFFARDPAFSCFSRLIASYMVECSSK